MAAYAKVDSWAARLLRRILVPRCLLCGDAGADGRDLCNGCRADMPANTVRCARCALPLPMAAPHCGACIRRPPPFTAAWAAFRYAHPLDLLETRFKFGGDLAAGRVLADLMIERTRLDPPARPDALLCVPLHTGRLRRRGYNQALELARPLARALDLPLLHDALVRTRATSAQTGLEAPARRRNLRGALALRAGIALPAHVAVLDDVMTTGATLGECARVLAAAGVARVDAWALARAP
ncbi:ComF family protein [Dokdonella koreensis]|uniref:Amidophosphoribosyltransferase n=1 Tax=Dokdonella koreensis DS-123 TaxID=1300342 RepID=A0A160DYT5_9GAMM|nr:ComF family protein [Dokdonella koreensis]ANB19641.1 Putative amidophosphoribosyltransferase [Dokdonella koreensis DS-123]